MKVRNLIIASLLLGGVALSTGQGAEAHGFAHRSLGLHTGIHHMGVGTGLHRMAPEHGGMMLHEDDVLANHPETRVQGYFGKHSVGCSGSYGHC